MYASSKRVKLNLPENVYKKIRCCLKRVDDDHHFANEAVVLECGGNACKKCIDGLKSYSRPECRVCGNYHSQREMENRSANPIVKDLVEGFIEDLMELMLNELKEFTEEVQDERFNEEIELRFQNVEYQFDVRIESLIEELHEYREKFKKKLDETKEMFKKSYCDNELRGMRLKLNDLTKNGVKSTYDDFMKTQTIIRECKNTLRNCMNQINQIRFYASEKCIKEDLIGDLAVPKWKNVKSTTEIPFSNKSDMTSIAYMESKNQIITCSRDTLFIMNLNDGSIQEFKHELVKNAYCLCVGKDDSLFVSENSNGSHIIIFDCNLNYLRRFTIIGYNTLVTMNIDMNDERIYVTHRNDNEVSIWSSLTGRAVDTFEIDRPMKVFFTKELIFVASSTSFYTDSNEIMNGSNCVFILSKMNYQVIRKIDVDNWLQPLLMSVDERGRMIILAFELDKEKRICGHYRQLIDKNGNSIQKIESGFGCFAVFLDNRHFTMNKKSITIVDYDTLN